MWNEWTHRYMKQKTSSRISPCVTMALVFLKEIFVTWSWVSFIGETTTPLEWRIKYNILIVYFLWKNWNNWWFQHIYLHNAVFQIVDSHGQPFKIWCRFKWENTLFTKIHRDYMDYFRMDYSVSTFIPQWGNNLDSLREDDGMLNKMVLFGVHEEYM